MSMTVYDIISNHKGATGFFTSLTNSPGHTSCTAGTLTSVIRELECFLKSEEVSADERTVAETFLKEYKHLIKLALTTTTGYADQMLRLGQPKALTLNDHTLKT